MRGKYSPGYSTDVGWEEPTEGLKHMCDEEVEQNGGKAERGLLSTAGAGKGLIPGTVNYT